MTINGTAYTGAYSASAPFAAWRTSTNSRTLQVSFDTDTSVTRNNGTYIYQVQPKCFASVQTTASWGAIPVNVRTDGVLIKTGDVIYATVTQTKTLEISMTALTAGADFDLYVKNGTSLPDNGDYTWRSIESTPSEAIEIPWGGSPRTLTIGIYSYSGAGHFALRVQAPSSARKVVEGSPRPSIKVCSPGAAVVGHANQNWVATVLQKTSLRTLIATEGTDFAPQFDVYQIPACGANPTWCQACDPTCKVCLTEASSSDSCGWQAYPGGTARVPNIACGEWSVGNGNNLAEILIHEIFGHAIYGFGDERGVAPPGHWCWSTTPPSCGDSFSYCGHSLMGHHAQSHTFCNDSPINHCYESVADPASMPAQCWMYNWGNWKPLVTTFGLSKSFAVSPDPTMDLPTNNPIAETTFTKVIFH